MRVSVDFDLCESNGLCEAVAPEVFELDEQDYLVVKTEEVAADQADNVRRAVAACPRTAITLIED